MHEPQDPHTVEVHIFVALTFLVADIADQVTSPFEVPNSGRQSGDGILVVTKKKTSVVRRSNVRTRLLYANHSKHAKSLVCCFSREASSYKLNPAAVEAWDVDWKG